MKIALETRFFRAVAPAMAKNDLRHYLNGAMLNLRAGNHAHLVATDGHRVHVCQLPEFGYVGKFLLPADLVMTIAKSKCGAVVLNIEAPVVSATIAGTTYTHELIDGNYPDYMRTFANLVTGECYINPKYAADAESAFRALSTRKCQVVPIVAYTPSGAVFYAPQCMIVLVMARDGMLGKLDAAQTAVGQFK